jgi:hypothetical protein
VPIARLAKEGAFAPEDIALLTGVFEDACRTLGLTDPNDRRRDIVAKKIIEAAQAGERDADRLRDLGLKEPPPRIWSFSFTCRKARSAWASTIGFNISKDFRARLPVAWTTYSLGVPPAPGLFSLRGPGMAGTYLPLMIAVAILLAMGAILLISKVKE